MQEKSLIKKNILQYLKIKDITKYEFYQKTGITRGILTQNNGMSEENTAKFLAYYPEISPEWLITGKGEMLKKDTPIYNNIEQDALSESTIDLPLIPYDALAGYLSQDIEGISLQDCETYRIPEFHNKGAEFLIRVSGSSMYPKYSNGDLLACKKINDILFFQWGKVYVIDSSQGPLVKRVFEDKENSNNILCVSDNKENYPPFPIPKTDIRSLSIVVGVIRLE